MNNMMIGGKKGLTERIFYGALDLIQERTGEDPVGVLSLIHI